MNLSEIKALDKENFLGVFGERLPVCFVRGEGCTLYFHGAKAGRKWELLQTSPTVGIELDCGYALMPADTACAHAAHFQSIIGTGRAEIIEDESQQRHALDALMRHAAGKGGWEIPAAALKSTCVFKVTVETLSCKQY